MRLQSSRVLVLLLSTLPALLALPACTKESRSKPDPVADEPAADKPEAIDALAEIGLGDAAPPADRFILLFRFDNLRAHELAPAAESIIAPLPDYKRVFGARPESEHGDLIGDVFSSVVLTTSDPTVLNATTLAATGPFEAEKMRAMLAYADSGLTWGTAWGGALGSIASGPRFPWSEARVFLMPAPSWIVLAHPLTLSELTRPLTADEKATNKVAPMVGEAWPAWLRQVLATERKSRDADRSLGELLVVARIKELDKMGLPTQLGQLSLPSPAEATIAAFATGKDVRFRGSLRFGATTDAAQFVTAASAAKLALKMKSVAASLPPGSLEALQNIAFYQDGNEVRWQTRASAADTRKMCWFSANMASRMMGKMSSLPRTQTPLPR